MATPAAQDTKTAAPSPGDGGNGPTSPRAGEGSSCAAQNHTEATAVDSIPMEPIQQAPPPAYQPPLNQVKGGPDPELGLQQPQYGGGPEMMLTPLEHLGREPRWIQCPFCHKRAMTKVTQEGSSMQVVVGVLLCLICICLACLPCLAHWFEDTDVRCSACGQLVAHIPHDRPIHVYRPPPPTEAAAAYPQQPPMAAGPGPGVAPPSGKPRPS